MHHNLRPYHELLTHQTGYGAASDLATSFTWHRQKTGDVLINSRNKQNAIISVVGRVIENRLDCTPSGNFSDRSFEKLATAKFQLHLEKPDDTIFTSDFDTAMHNLESLQQKLAPGKTGQNLVVLERDEKVLRFTRPVFEVRQPRLSGELSSFHSFHKLISYLSLPCIGPIDDVTEHWPIQPELRNMLDRIKTSHRAVPLRVFVNKRLIPPEDVCDILTGALIELHFELYHFSIQSQNVESFNVKIEQVMVLQPGKPRPATLYKRSTAEEGPIHMNPTLAALLNEEPLSISNSHDIAPALTTFSANASSSSQIDTTPVVGLPGTCSYSFCFNN